MAPPLTQETRFALPGFTLPLKWKPVSGLEVSPLYRYTDSRKQNEGFGSYRELFPCALDPSQMDTGGYLTCVLF